MLIENIEPLFGLNLKDIYSLFIRKLHNKGMQSLSYFPLT